MCQNYHHHHQQQTPVFLQYPFSVRMTEKQKKWKQCIGCCVLSAMGKKKSRGDKEYNLRNGSGVQGKCVLVYNIYIYVLW